MSVVQKFDADAGSLEKALEDLGKKYEKLKQKISESGDVSKRSSDVAVGGVSNLIGSLSQAAAGYFSVTAALEIHNRELQRKLELEKKSASFAVNTASGDIAVRAAIGDVRRDEYQKFLSSVRQMNVDTKFGDERSLKMGAASVLSGTGGNQELTLDILRAAAPLYRDKPADLPSFAGGVADLVGQSGMNAVDAVSLAQAAMGQARMSQFSAFAEVAKALKGGQAFAGTDSQQTAKEILGLFSAFSVASGDTTGAETKTSVVSLMSKLEKHGGQGGVMDRVNNIRAQVAAGTVKESELLSGFSGPAQGIVRDLFRGGGEISGILPGVMDKVTGSREAYERMVADVTDGTFGIAALVEERGNVAQSEFAMGDPILGRDASLRDRIKQRFRKGRTEMKTTVPEHYEAGLRDMVNTRFGWGTDLEEGYFRPWSGGEVSTQSLAAQSMRSLERYRAQLGDAQDPRSVADRQMLTEQIEAMKDLLEQAKETNRLLAGRAADPRTAAATQAERD